MKIHYCIYLPNLSSVEEVDFRMNFTKAGIAEVGPRCTLNAVVGSTFWTQDAALGHGHSTKLHSSFQ